MRDAYRFIANNYAGGNDRIFIFGHSRGSYAARILSGLIYAAGLPAYDILSERKQKRFVRQLYASYKGKHSDKERFKRIEETYKRWNLKHYEGVGEDPVGGIRIVFLGLWDTIEALGVPDYEEDIGEVNKRYVDQICNVNRAYHAVALDDNRAHIYTPILLTGKHLTQRCARDRIDTIVEEVWFSGAHADVGGGYKEGFLTGPSLNWMINGIDTEVPGKKLLPTGVVVNSVPYDIIHDAQGGNGLFRLIFGRYERNIAKYKQQNQYNNGKLKLHVSVLERLRETEPRVNWKSDPEGKVETYDKYRRLQNGSVKALESTWFKHVDFAKCVKKSARPVGYEIYGDCFEIVGP